MSLDLNEFAKEVHKNAVEHGWWDKDKSFGEVAALIHSELSEALEEYRAGHPNVWYSCEVLHDGSVCVGQECLEDANWKNREECQKQNRKPEGIAVDLIDAVIRILDYTGKMEVDAVNPPPIKKKGYTPWYRRTADKEFPDMLAEWHCKVSEAYRYFVVKSKNETQQQISENTGFFCLRSVVQSILWWIKQQGLDPEQLLIEKHEFNKTRPYRHGGKVC